MRSLAHALVGLAATFVARRALEQPWVSDQLPDAWTAAALRVGIPTAIALGMALAIGAGLIGRNGARAFRDDMLSIVAVFFAMFVIAVGPLSRDAVGLLFVAIIALRIG